MNVSDPHWQTTCLAIIEFFTQVWGGENALIIPTDGNAIDDVFWKLLSAFDPDWIMVYQKTFEDIRRHSPDEFKKSLEKQVKQIPTGLESENDKHAAAENLAKTPTDQFALSPALIQQLLIRLAPFNVNNKVGGHKVRAGSLPANPLTLAINVIDQVAHANGTVEIKNDTTLPELWLAASFGYSTGKYYGELNQHNVPATPVFLSQYDEWKLINFVVQPWKQFSGRTLFEFSRLGLASVRSIDARTFELPTLIIFGDSLKDFCLFYSLLKLHGRAAWAPSWVLQKENGHYARLSALINAAEELGESEQIESCVCTSLSLAQSQIEEILTSLVQLLPNSTTVYKPFNLELLSSVVNYPLLHYVQGNIKKSSTHQLLNDELPGNFDSPIPNPFKSINVHDHRWIVEVEFLKNLLPRHPTLGKEICRAPNLAWARAGSDGVSYLCPGALVWGTDVNFNLLRPSLKVLDAFEVFRQTLAYCSYDCEVSDKGRYEAVAIEKLGGIAAAGQAFRNIALADVLAKYLDKSPPSKGVYDEGVLLKDDDRRYLNFICIAKLLGNDKHMAIQIIDDFIAKEIFYRGLILGCGYCSNVDWFSISDITHQFTCRRCGKIQQYTKANWKHPEEPSWFYKLDELVYQALRNNSMVPILTLNAILNKSRDSFLFCPELRIRLQGQKKHAMELDICCVPDGKLCIGEAKSNGSLATADLSAAQAAEKYCDVAEKLGATRVVFSTSEEKWDTSSEAAIASVFAGHPHILISMFTKVDLFYT
jgi:hypothetical protein